MGLSTHILDTSRGRPAAGVPVTLERDADGTWETVRTAATNDDGRVGDLLGEGGSLTAGRYRLTFDTGGYFGGRDQECFYPSVTVAFEVKAVDEHYHVPLLLNPFGYSTYRGS